MPDFVGPVSPLPPEIPARVLRWEYRLGGVFHLGLQVALLTPGTDESTAAPALIGPPALRLERETTDRLEAKALGRWAWEGGRTY
jgi:hypothetical protein